MKVRLISKTQVVPEIMEELDLSNTEALMIWIARVSSSNQDNPEYAGLLNHCAKEGHWSVFEMVDATVEIETSRFIAQQILRHKSFCFQEFSQRYQVAGGVEYYEARGQAKNNRQSSIDNLLKWKKTWFLAAQKAIEYLSFTLYRRALEMGISRESARVLLPLNTKTKLYMKGSMRSWIHFLTVRTDKHTQEEHRDIANEIQDILKKEFPTIGKAMGW